MNKTTQSESIPTRRQFSAAEKVAVLRKHLLENKPLSELCKEFDIQPTQFYQWQKVLFENATAAFEKNGRGNKAKTDGKDRKIAHLEEKVVKKNEVIAELMEEHAALKKNLGEA